jgi:hypothetical protein
LKARISQLLTSKILVRVLLVALPIAYFAKAITGKIALLQGDAWVQNFPLRVLAGAMIADGHIPLWNPYIYGGTPLMASVYPGVFYPPNWLFAILPALAAMHIVVISTYHLALVGTYLYARRIGLDRLSSLLSGVVFTFSAFMIAHLEQTSRISAAAWLPWILLAVEHLYRRVSLRWTLLGSLFVALQFFAGEPQMTTYSFLSFLPWRRETGMEIHNSTRCNGRDRSSAFIDSAASTMGTSAEQRPRAYRL